MSARRVNGGDLKDSKEEGGEEAMAMAEAEATSDSGMEMMVGHDEASDETDLTLNAESNRESKKPRLSTTEAASNESLTAKSSPEVSAEADAARAIDELEDANSGGKVGGGAMQRAAGKPSMDESELNSEIKAGAPESAHLLALTSGTSLSDATAVVALVSYKSLISSMARANESNIITAENFYLLHWLYRIRNVSCLRGLRISFLQPDFLWSIYSPMMRSKKLWRTDGDIKVAADLWCVDRAAAEERYGHISDWDVSSVTDMSRLFQGQDLAEPMEDRFRGKDLFNDDISRWNVSEVTDTSDMFYCAVAFNQLVGDWNVSKVTNMESMFYRARSFNQPVGDWDVSKVTNMRFMFGDARVFNQPVGDWDVSEVTNMSYMFCHAQSFNQPIGDWNVSNVICMGCMFHGALSFNQPVGDWDVSNVTNMSHMFRSAGAFNQDLTRWDMRSVEYTSSTFKDAYAMQRDNKPAAVRDDVYDDSDDDEEEEEGDNDDGEGNLED